MPSSDGILHSLRQFGDGVLRSVEKRVELVSIELQEEKIRLIRLLVWSLAGLGCAMMALTFVSFTVVVIFWETARLPVLLGFSGLYLAAIGFAAYKIKRLIVDQPRPFDATLDELSRDRECLNEQES